MSGLLTENYHENMQMLDALLHTEESFDLIKRELILCGRNAAMYFVDGFVKDEVMEKIMEYLMGLDEIDQSKVKDLTAFCNTFIPYVEVNVTEKADELAAAVLSGSLLYLLEGYAGAIVIDVRTYPVRNVEEPENDKVLRGPREGFVETIIFNTALIRRHIRDTGLRMSMFSIGESSRTDVVVCYMENRADPALVKTVKEKIAGIKVKSLNLSQESLAEALIHQKWYNPFPKIRYTERPDAACASLQEGSVLIICDGSPAVMVLPTTIFSFAQETDDYYFPPFTGTYLRLVRFVIYFLTIFLTPIWFLLIQNPQWPPPWLEFIKVEQPAAIPVIFQLLLIELAVDGLKLASLNTPSMLSNSLSVVGGLILGEFAINTGWFTSEVILYMAFVAISNFTQPSYELGYAFKFMRVLLLILTALFNAWGFGAGLILMTVFICSNRTITGGHSYLYPLIPFNARAFKRIFVREKLR